MDLPLGTSLRSGLKTGETNLLQILSNMISKGFSGYIISTVEGYLGIEQGMLLFKKGRAAGAYYEFVSHSVEVSSDPAVRLILNSFLARHGIIDINALTIQQIDLITAFQEKILTSEPIDEKKLNRIFPKTFNKELAKQYVKQKVEETTRFDVFKQTGLLGVEEK